MSRVIASSDHGPSLVDHFLTILREVMARHFTLRCTQGLTMPCNFEMAASTHCDTAEWEQKKRRHYYSVHSSTPIDRMYHLFFTATNNKFISGPGTAQQLIPQTHVAHHITWRPKMKHPKTHVTHFVSCLQLERAPKDAQEYKFPKMYIYTS